MIEFKNLSAGYLRNDLVIKNADLTLNNGQITVLLGRNGSGKTTLIKAIMGEAKTNGDIFIDGEKNIVSREIALLPQLLPNPSGITVRETVALGRMPHTGFFGRLSEKDNELVDKAILALGLDGLKDKLLTDVSGGERQKAFFAFLVAKDAKNIILDEPTSNLDTKNKRELFDFIREMKSRGKAILAVLHDVNDALSIADSISVISDGKTVFFGNTDEFIKSGIAEKEFGLKPVAADCNGKKQIFFI